ncbi:MULTISPECIES: helix-turn-helix transcriptional regulator [Levilactobacillus]|uniref:helix-turn-helix transcriptional regulator n=1 Tax=Levilactobacillus TaxID=2767886 RepID=UPI00194E6A7B|nr:WYL domain-containing protein [Levilactobacillus sp. 244-2]
MKGRERAVDVLVKLLAGEKITTDTNGKETYQVSERSLERDTKLIRETLADNDSAYQLQQKGKTYWLAKDGALSAEEILALLKIVIGTRSLTREELLRVKDNLLDLVADTERGAIQKLISNSLVHYTPLFSNGDKEILPLLKDFANWVSHKTPIKFHYRSSVPDAQGRALSKPGSGVPLSIYFADFYFYVVMYIPEINKSLVYRLDRFQDARTTRAVVKVPGDKKIDEGALRNKTYLLSGGTDIPYEFRYWGYPQTALDKLPNSRITEWNREDGSVTIKGDHLASQGALLWVLSQGAQIQVVAPQSLVDSVKHELTKTMSYYD